MDKAASYKEFRSLYSDVASASSFGVRDMPTHFNVKLKTPNDQAAFKADHSGLAGVNSVQTCEALGG